ncbi:MAG: type I DNA topoisomerase [Prevotella shahii]|jgi:DNA topoisomerase I|uniref:type I DNA topoisomerase n=1 Tax=Hoylesella shahii TaxID=228603 RepID=UPI001CAAA86A|nr:type I DNA topoisomerase [Hoylesella shahii]MBF1569136.1 type I DNA topoisomerase [Hoylesella shahii]
MQQNLVIVESPAKAKTIEKFLGKDFKVMSSYGHIRDLKKTGLSVDLNSFEPHYEISDDKKKVVAELQKAAKAAQRVWLASDEDREGEAISWHLCEVLGLDEEKTNRIVFHEITKPAILRAIEQPRHVDMNLVDAQQARRVLDRMVGFMLSPILWRKVKPSLSAGRVQSVAVRLVVDRERELHAFKAEPFYRVTAIFAITNEEGGITEVDAELDTRFKTHEEALAFLEKCKNASFSVESVAKKPSKRSPAPPFTTSTLQQEAARKLGFSVSQTMMVAQRLYESGRITYMRTDSVNLSGLCINATKEEVIQQWGEQYSAPRNFHTHAKGAQEAHEAIRPTYMNVTKIEGTQQEKKLYDLIWKRTTASQMAEAQVEKTRVTINITGASEHFVATGEVIVFDGFLKVYRESTDDEDEAQQDASRMLPPMKEGDKLERREITAIERFSQGPSRYTEASLVHKMEELGIGRPSTYAPTISTIQQRQYVTRGDSKGKERQYVVDTLKGLVITTKNKKENVGGDKGKLLPTDVGIVVNDFLMESFPSIMDYNFTARVEEDFDRIAEGQEQWKEMMKNFYAGFGPTVDTVMNARSEHKAGERVLGEDPATGKPVLVKIGRFGPVAQIGIASDDEKPRFSNLTAGLSIETITLEEALELFKLPRTIGEFEGKPVVIGTGRFGPYILHDKKYTSLPSTEDPHSVTLETSVALIEQKRMQEKQKHLKSFSEDEKLEVINGKYGPYLAYDGKNYKLPKELHEKAAELTYEQCMELVNAAPAKPKKTARKTATGKAKK